MKKLEQLLGFIADRLAERSTYEGLVFIFTVCGSHYQNLDWGQCATLGATASGIIKIIFPDAKPKDAP